MQDYTRSSNGFTVRVEAALEYRGVMSDYVAVMDGESCELPVVISK